MARPIPCDNDHGELAVMLSTNMLNGDVSAVCGACLHGWAQALADATRPEPEPDPAAGATANGAGAGEGGAAQTPPRPKRRQAGRQAAPENITAPESPFIDPAPVDS